MPITPTVDDKRHPLAPLCQRWLKKIEEAKKIKWDRFGKYAVETMKFYDGAHDWMWKEEYATGVGGFLEKGAAGALPMFRMTVNRVFEAVALFGPSLYHKNPDITVTPVSYPEIDPALLGLDPQNPQTQQQYQQVMSGQQQAEASRELHARIYEHYANWVQRHTDKKRHSRMAITEALIKGMGLLWTELHKPRGRDILHPRSVFVSVDDIVLDPDAEYWDDIQYIARYHCRPVNLVEEEFELPPGSLKGHLKSRGAQAHESAYKRERSKLRKYGKTFDLIEYWEVYSKNGFGHRLRGVPGTAPIKQNLSFLGDYCRVVVSNGVPFPLNMPTELLEQGDMERLFEAAQWPIPFWTDGGWPFVKLAFYDKPRSVWPISLFKPAIGEMRFVNWCMSFLADKVAAGSTTYVGVAKQAGMEIQNQLKSGMAPYTVIEISQLTGRSIKDVVAFLDAPQFSIDIWNMVAQVMRQIDKRTGLTELLYGMSEKQLRSATEADLRGQNVNIRPDDMASHVEDFLSETAMKEIETMVWALDREDVQPVVGDIASVVFENDIKTMDFQRMVMDYDYRVAAGSARKPNKQTRQRALTELGQVMLPTLQQFAAQGLVQPWNAYITEVANTMDIDPEPFLIQLPEQGEQQGPTPEEQQAQMEAQMKQLEMQLKQQQAQLDAQAKQQDMQIKQRQASQDMRIKEEELKIEEKKSAQEMLIEKAQQALEAREINLQMQLEKEKAKTQIAKTRASGNNGNGSNGD